MEATGNKAAKAIKASARPQVRVRMKCAIIGVLLKWMQTIARLASGNSKIRSLACRSRSVPALPVDGQKQLLLLSPPLRPFPSRGLAIRSSREDVDEPPDPGTRSIAFHFLRRFSPFSDVRRSCQRSG